MSNKLGKITFPCYRNKVNDDNRGAFIIKAQEVIYYLYYNANSYINILWWWRFRSKAFKNAPKSTGPHIHFYYCYKWRWFPIRRENVEIKLIGMVSILDEPINHEIEHLGEPAAPIVSFPLSFCCMGNVHTSRKYLPSRGNRKDLLSFVRTSQFDYLRIGLGRCVQPWSWEASSSWTCIRCSMFWASCRTRRRLPQRVWMKPVHVDATLSCLRW